MSKHTKEPWPFFVDWAEPSTPHPESEPIVRLGYDDYQRARYCVNACQGVSNGQLALTSVSGAILMLKEAGQQCDELLAALKEVVICAEGAMNQANAAGAGWDIEFTLQVANELLAKAKGGAA